MTCKNTLENINRFLDNDLFGDAAVNVVAHLNRCVACRHEFDQMRDVQSALRRLPVPSGADPARERVFIRLERSVRTESVKPRRAMLPLAHWRTTVATMTTLAAVGGVLFLLPRPTAPEALPLPAPAEMSVLYHLHDAHGAGSLIDEPIARRDSAAEARSALLWDADSALKESF